MHFTAIHPTPEIIMRFEVYIYVVDEHNQKKLNFTYLYYLALYKEGPINYHNIFVDVYDDDVILIYST